MPNPYGNFFTGVMQVKQKVLKVLLLSLAKNDFKNVAGNK